MRVLALLLAGTLSFLPSSQRSVSVAYAGSLTACMEGPLSRALQSRTGIRFVGEGKGSRELANLIAAGLRTPDVFLSADPAILDGLSGSAHGNLVQSYTIFGTSPLVIGYSGRSRFAGAFAQAAAGKRSLLAVLSMPGIRVGRTDPRLDPKGKRTIAALTAIGGHASVVQTILSKESDYPEEDLAVRVQTGELDAGFFYTTETAPLGLDVVRLPNAVTRASQSVYAIAQMRLAPHPAAARRFLDFLLRGEGRHILERAGVRYYAKLKVVDRSHG